MNQPRPSKEQLTTANRTPISDAELQPWMDSFIRERPSVPTNVIRDAMRVRFGCVIGTKRLMEEIKRVRQELAAR